MSSRESASWLAIENGPRMNSSSSVRHCVRRARRARARGRRTPCESRRSSFPARSRRAGRRRGRRTARSTRRVGAARSSIRSSHGRKEAKSESSRALTQAGYDCARVFASSAVSSVGTRRALSQSRFATRIRHASSESCRKRLGVRLELLEQLAESIVDAVLVDDSSIVASCARARWAPPGGIKTIMSQWSTSPLDADP